MKKESIIAQLSRILNSTEFSTKPLMRKLLQYLTDKYILKECDQLKAYTIATELFGRGEQFDPDQNALVRIYVGRLRRSLKIYYLEEGRDDPIQIEIPKGNYCPLITDKQQISSVPKFATDSASSVVIIDNTIAVLPFENHSKDQDLDYLAIGFSRELSDALTKYDELKVIGIDRVSNVSLSGSREIEQLRDKGISFLIDGELMAFGSQVKVRFRLIHIPDKSQVWVGDYKFDREKDNLFDILEKVSHYIIKHLGGAYGHVNKYRYQKLLASKPTSLNEQELLLKYYHSQTVLSPDIIQEFYTLAYEVLQKEPDSALANALVASINSTVYSHDLPGAEDAYIKFGELAEKAYNLNSNHKLAFSTLAAKCFYYDERDRLLRLFEEGQKWLPNIPLGMGLFGLWFSFIGRWEFGKALIDKLFEDNVFVPSWYHSATCLYHYRQHDYEAAMIEASKLQLPGTFVGPAHRIPPLGQLGRIDEAKKEFQNLLKLRPDFIKRGRYLLSIHIKDNAVVDHLLEGFEKIGVKID